MSIYVKKTGPAVSPENWTEDECYPAPKTMADTFKENMRELGANAARAFDDCHPDPVNKPAHYTAHPSGVEAIQVTEHFNFCLGNAIKYIWRAGRKGDTLEDLRKAEYYIKREIERVKKGGE